MIISSLLFDCVSEIKSHYRRSSQCRIGPHSVRQSSTTNQQPFSSYLAARSTTGALPSDDRSLQEVFKLFDLIHIVTTDHKILTRITQEVVEDFAAENVVYLELRTTPKEPLKVSRLLKEIIKVSSGYHHSSAITGVVGQVGLLSRVHFFFLLSLEETEYANTKSKVRNMEERHENLLLDYVHGLPCRLTLAFHQECLMTIGWNLSKRVRLHLRIVDLKPERASPS